MTPASEAPFHYPTGTVTFLFTDIEGSTVLWEQDPARMPAALARHDELLRRAIKSCEGHVVKTTGDGVYAVFATAGTAIAASLAAQRLLQEPQIPAAPAGADKAVAPIALKVRMGLHTGTAELRDGDYFGSALNRTARIMSIAHGGQILLSAATAELVRGGLPEGVTLRDMGEHRLKGLLNPERVLQVMAPDLRTEFPPVASVTGHSLPAERDDFVGRGESLGEMRRRLAAGSRLVSVLGLGGTGKTRLVTRFGWNSLRDFPGGVWFCDLSEARSVDGVLHAVAQGLDVPLGNDDPVIQLGQSIAGRGRCLVILDNFEQVSRHAEETLGKWLNRAGEARFLVTTREVLGLRGEEVLPLPPLAPPDAIQLFLRRAQAAKPGFQPNAEDQASIDSLVRLLDGLPLAIELAAARIRVMGPPTLLARMSDRFKLLSSMGGRLDRQATLRAVFDWSWDLLTVPEKSALAQLSVFEAGFTLEAAEAILDLRDCEAPWTVDVLQSLVQKSLVRQMTHERFDLLVSVQEYAAEHLRTVDRYAGSGPAAALATERRHAAYFASLEQSMLAQHAGAELDNLVVACRRSAAHGDATTAAKTLQAAWSMLVLRGPFRIAVELASLVQAIPELQPGTAAIVHGVAGHALRVLRNVTDARTALEASLEQARAVGDRACETRALLNVAVLDMHAGHTRSAQKALELALAAARELSDYALESEARNVLGTLQVFIGKSDTALPHFEAALGLARKARDVRREVIALCNLGTPEVSGVSKARAHCEAALAMARSNGDRLTESNTLCNLGLLNYFDGRLEDALEHLDMGLVVAREIGHVVAEGNVLCNLGMVHDALADLDQAETHYDAALAIAREFELRRLEGQILGYAGVLSARRGRFDEARSRLDAGEALVRTVSDAVSLGILLCNRCEAEQLAGSSSTASAALAAAEEIASKASAAADSELHFALARVRRLSL